MEKRYSEHDVQEILNRAVRLDSSRGSSTRESLERAAEELGLTPEALAQAEEQWEREKQDQEEFLAFMAYQRKGYYSNLFMYLIFIPFFLFLDLSKDGQLNWALYPILGWGLGVAIHTVGVFSRKSHWFDEQFQEWKAAKKVGRPYQGSSHF